MGRFLNENGLDVFDDGLGPSGDWIRFKSRDDAAAYVNGETRLDENGNLVKDETQTVDGYVDVRVIAQASPLFAAYNAVVAAGAPFELLQPNPARQRVMLNYLGTGVLIVGTREGVLGGQGYGLATGQQVEWKTSGNIWCVTVGGSGVVYVLSETTS